MTILISSVGCALAEVTATTGGAAAGATAGFVVGMAIKVIGGAPRSKNILRDMTGTTLAGSIIGAVVDGSVSNAIAGGLAGGYSSFNLLKYGMVPLPAESLGLLVTGAQEEDPDGTWSFDCWKAVVHDETKEPSNGKLLREIVEHPNLKRVTTWEAEEGQMPEIELENVWNEKFRIEYITLPWGQVTAHAVPLPTLN